ncbi:GAF domain-containing protein [Mumia sp. ZJ1417]|uniref:sensor histidine kinase n=1 Tax=Mumia sp. ZJ1417 TaxID=2708082 RepID=UPI00141F3E36|nr:GAF domain-containing protein [Mumia sp. ZJ1417]QMW66395.1 GAF domain-containing protein [Mumia sp. ZJ1417]
MTSRADVVEDAADRLRLLLDANRTLVEELDLPEVLRRIVTAAIDLVGARYGAIGVFDDDGRLEVFIHAGIDDETAAQIGHLPRGRGLLGDLLDGGPAVRLDDVTTHPHYTGFPAEHPPMRSFLGLGLEVRGRVYGNLYLTDSAHGTFSEEDAELARALGETAGVAIANARLYDESRRREAWSSASAEVTRELLSPDGIDALELVAVRVQELTRASLVAVLLPAGDGTYAVSRAAGTHSQELVGVRTTIAAAAPVEPTIGTVAAVCAPLGLDLPDVPASQAMLVPLVDADDPRGILVVLRDGPPRFDDTDLSMAEAFAGQAALALGKRDLRQAREAMLVLEDRDRIARDLHDHVIQRLFASGLTLQSVHATIPVGAPRDRLAAQVAEMDETIRQIRRTIFELHDTDPGQGGVRRRLRRVVSATGDGGTAVTLQIDGPVDLALDDGLADDVVAVAREGVSNARRHAQAERIELRCVVRGGEVVVTVNDDGRGIPEHARRSGLDNLARRAEARCGTCRVTSGRGGTTLRWAAPIPDEGYDA